MQRKQLKENHARKHFTFFSIVQKDVKQKIGNALL